MKEKVHIIANKELLDSYRKNRPELKGLTYTALADIMLRKAIKEAAK